MNEKLLNVYKQSRDAYEQLKATFERKNGQVIHESVSLLVKSYQGEKEFPFELVERNHKLLYDTSKVLDTLYFEIEVEELSTKLSYTVCCELKNKLESVKDNLDAVTWKE